MTQVTPSKSRSRLGSRVTTMTPQSIQALRSSSNPRNTEMRRVVSFNRNQTPNLGLTQHTRFLESMDT